MPNMSSIGQKMKESLRFHSGCHGNLVSKETSQVANIYCLREPPHYI